MSAAAKTLPAPTITVGTPQIEPLDDRARWSVAVDGPRLPKHLWYEVPLAFAEMLSDRADAALVVLTPPALHLGASIIVEGTVTDELAFNYADIQSLLAATGQGSPKCLTVCRTKPATAHATGVASGFSAGIDSFAVLAEHLYARDIPATKRLSHLLFNNVGSHGRGGHGDALARARWDRLAPVVDEIGLPAITVNSNVDAFYDPPLWFFLNHTLRNASVAHLLSRGIRSWLYASAYDYPHIRVDANETDSAHNDPITLPLLSTATLSLRPTGTRVTRTEKTAIVANMPLSWQYLDVCSNIDTVGAQQCSDCMKCRRTLLTLEVLGVVDRYSDIFDLPHWSKIRDTYLWEIFAGTNDPFGTDIKRLIRERDYASPRSSMSSLHSYASYVAKRRLGVTMGYLARKARTARRSLRARM